MPSAGTQRLANSAAAGAAAGSRKMVYDHMRRRRRLQIAGAAGACLVILNMGGDGDGTTAEPAEAISAEAGTATITQPLSAGSTGTDVLVLQERLNAAGYPVAVDGVFGSDTDAAVRTFQDDEGLVVDGVVGPQTAAALGLSISE
jgi:murein L,D-transpeptidase YcbB/YkuD